MLSVFVNRAYRHLFLAQVMAQGVVLLVTGALTLPAHEVAGEDTVAVFGTALAIKMLAYVGIVIDDLHFLWPHGR